MVPDVQPTVGELALTQLQEASVRYASFAAVIADLPVGVVRRELQQRHDFAEAAWLALLESLDDG